MTNKRKQRARTISQKTGMSYKKQPSTSYVRGHLQLRWTKISMTRCPSRSCGRMWKARREMRSGISWTACSRSFPERSDFASSGRSSLQAGLKGRREMPSVLWPWPRRSTTRAGRSSLSHCFRTEALQICEISKASEQFIVEVRRVTGAGHGWDKTGPLKQALAGIQTRTPIMITGYYWDSRTSFKGFERHLRAQLAEPPLDEAQSFSQDGLSVEYKFIKDLGIEVPVISSSMTTLSGQGERDAVRSAIDQKLSKYKLPLIVALDLAGVLGSFMTVEDVVLGELRLLLQVPRTATELAQAEPPRQVRGPGLFHGDSHSAVRARSRLHGVLAFETVFDPNGRGLAVRPGFFANPSPPEARSFDSFAPIPRLVVTKREPGRSSLEWIDGKGSRHKRSSRRSRPLTAVPRGESVPR